MAGQVKLARMGLALLLLFWSAGCTTSREVAFSVTLNPNGNTPLAAEAKLEASEPVQITRVEIEGGVSSDIQSAAPSASAVLPILGFYPDTKHKVRLHFRRKSAPTVETTEQVEVVTKPLPVGFPIIEVKKGDPKIPSEGGYLLVSLSPLERGEPLDQKGLAVLTDSQGRVLWYMPTDSSIGAMTLSKSGHLLLQQFKSLRQEEVTWTGSVVRAWQSDGLRSVSPGSLSVKADSIHHDFQELDGGEFWVLSSRVREDKGQRRVDELLLRFDAQGQVLEEISLMDMLDPAREVHARYPNYWEMFYGRGVIDWGHANSLQIDSAAGKALISLAYQDAVVMIDLATRKPLWILGRPEGWNPPLASALLKPKGRLEWPTKQHCARLTKEGTVLLFDNGSKQSRAVEYRVNPSQMTVEQVWQFTDTKPFHSSLLSGVRQLPRTGNIEIADGTRSAMGGGYWCRVLEVTHTNPGKKVLEISFRRPGGAGVSLYRCERLPSLYL